MYAIFWKLVSSLFLVGFTGTCLLGYLLVNHSMNYGQVHPLKSKPRLHTFAFSYMDQMTWAARRLKSLQCWAAEWKTRYKVHVVEPFVIKGTRLGVPNEINQNQSAYLKFSSIFDISAWNWGKRNTYPEMISWDIFLKYAPRNVVAVQIVYLYDYHCTENSLSEDYCGFTLLNQSITDVLAPHNFTVLNKVCINFRILGSLTEYEFNHLILKNIPPDMGVTVVFDEWRGTPNQRGAIDCWILINSGKCSQDAGTVPYQTSKTLIASSKIKKTANKYISRYLNWKPGYLAVMIRWEKIVLYDFYFGDDRQHYTGVNCTRLINDYIHSIYERRRVNATFLSTDIGKYGSSTFDLYNTTRASIANITMYTEELMRTVHHNDSMSLAEYERRFEEVSGTTHPAFIAQLQKAIAIGARCLLLVGGGTFHENTMRLFRQIHRKEKNICIEVIEKC